ncbi:hypothetical protein ACERZ8_19550 [Tateyamaria armeniaca]|uniref:Uncharacterized protein n=1 Tax=Tateyamaria armeniaca TaxID=2518930 RepID=A0ABW8UYR1_9RHOB
MTISNRRGCLRQEYSRIFDEECVGYAIDDSGIVRRRFDEAFESERTNTILTLNAGDLAAALEHVSSVDRMLLQVPMDGRSAVRGIFDAAENIFRIMFPTQNSLNSAAIRSVLQSSIQARFEGQSPEQQASLKTVRSFSEWIDAAHFYRHADGQTEPSQPSEMTTVVLVGQGYSFVRWLASLYHEQHN